ncbi:glycoside hydrolase superfamily [Phakopsora pachyrhizi]|uniref:glucan 1,3-beta-glucosidase n=1 Tax=Phakopsora pachyrhizi TaxID=170000 RepID=A0AAV0BPB7_PHAPC|nr:glycoside hydrolase superfamily [Phakopsora pachyrhizi]KAI8449785.1 glycoside hydrolase superfamily [Phakopsora pachyrhizi]CAH7689154.1 glycoside hydrolase superfamily [Phakopsora pachyrhizi]
MIETPVGGEIIRSRKRPWIFIVISVVLAVCAIVIPISVVVTSRHGSSSDANLADIKSAKKSNRTEHRGGSSVGPDGLAAKPKWNFSKDKMIGLSLGNWLVLERWMNEDWFVDKAGPNSWDEWSFTMAQGSNATNALEEHWSTWVTEDDIEKVYRAGINTLRIPTGFWMWIDTVSPEPFIQQGQMAHFERVCGYAYARNMYIIIDLHGLPGSQNGEQQSGHNTTTPSFYQPLQQARSDLTVKAVVDWVSQSPFHSIISAIEVANEPRPYTTEQRAMLRAYYERSYNTIQTLGDKAPAMFFADGYVPGNRLAYWYDFAAAHKTEPPSLLFTDHPYPGFFPAQNNSADIFKQTCTKGAQYQNFPVTTAITEWSLRTGIQENAFDKSYYSIQLSTWSWFAGSCFWSLRVLDSKNPVLADPVAQYQFSFLSLLERGSILIPEKNRSASDFIASIQSPCGAPVALNSNAPPPQGTAAATAISAAAEAKALIDGINKSVAEAGKGLHNSKSALNGIANTSTK